MQLHTDEESFDNSEKGKASLLHRFQDADEDQSKKSKQTEKTEEEKIELPNQSALFKSLVNYANSVLKLTIHVNPQKENMSRSAPKAQTKSDFASLAPNPAVSGYLEIYRQYLVDHMPTEEQRVFPESPSIPSRYAEPKDISMPTYSEVKSDFLLCRSDAKAMQKKNNRNELLIPGKQAKDLEILMKSLSRVANYQDTFNASVAVTVKDCIEKIKECLPPLSENPESDVEISKENFKMFSTSVIPALQKASNLSDEIGKTCEVLFKSIAYVISVVEVAHRDTAMLDLHSKVSVDVKNDLIKVFTIWFKITL